MTLLGFLSTIVFTATLVSVICAYAAWHFTQQAMHEALRLRTSRGTISALEGAVEALDGKMRSLHGRVSAEKRWRPDHEQPISTAEPPFGDMCPNWRTTAYPEGDDCNYCAGMRAERARLRANGVGSVALGKRE